MSSAVSILETLIGFDTTSRNPNRALIDYVADILSACGTTAQIIEDKDGGKANLYAVTGGAGGETAKHGGVMLSGHTDVVPVDGQSWTVPPFECTYRDERYYGRGAADMKGFVASAINAFIEATALELRSPLHLALSYDEEVGCLGVRSLIEMMGHFGITPAMCVVGEPTEMKLAVGHKGKMAIKADCIGREAHSALAPSTVNALHLACDLVVEIRHLQEELRCGDGQDNDYDIPFTTLHVGRVNGGVQVNIVARSASVEFEIRSIAADNPAALLANLENRVEPVLRAARRLVPEADIKFTITNSYPGLNTEKNSEAAAFMRDLTGANTMIKVAFGTEGGLFSERLKIPTVVCGPGSMAQGHKPDEYVSAAQLAQCDQMLRSLTERLVVGL